MNVMLVFFSSISDFELRSSAYLNLSSNQICYMFARVTHAKVGCLWYKVAKLYPASATSSVRDLGGTV